MINILNPMVCTHERRRQKYNANIIYFQNILIIQGNILDDVINLECFQNSKEKMGEIKFKPFSKIHLINSNVKLIQNIYLSLK